jgi:Spy/CpxP family protein refolding chaperone
MRLTRSTATRGLAAVAVLAMAGFALLVFPVVRASQPPREGYKWWQTQKQEFGLTEEQSTRIESIFQASVPRLRESKKELDRLEDILSKMIADGVADEAIVAQQVDRVEAARSAMSKARTLMLYRMHQVLNPAQRAKLNAWHEQRERERDKGKKPDRDHR